MRRLSMTAIPLLLMFVVGPVAADTVEEAMLEYAIAPVAAPANASADRYRSPENSSGRSRFSDLSDAAFFYLSLAEGSGWQPVPAGPLLRLGDRHSQVSELRALLSLYGDLPYISGARMYAGNLFDQPLHDALIRFQKRHGAKPDGILGPKTRAVLNVPPRQRALQIAVNLERQRQFRGREQSRYVQVNIPEYRLRFFDQGAEILAMKTIIGRRTRQTPMLESKIRTLVLNPSWNVPQSIAYKDILPSWQEDSDYLSKHDLRVVTGWTQPRQELAPDQVDLSRLYRGKEYLRFWQPPGEKNALGRVKFLFPNPHSVYLHDTPTRNLFENESRAFSSGCIRLEKPLQLAQTLLSSSGTLNSSSIDEILDRKQTKAIRLRQPVPLYLTYWTAWLDEDQVLNFGEDIYRQDSVELSRQLL